MSQQFIIKKPRTLFRRKLRLAPGCPIDDRVLVKEDKPESVTEGGLAVAEESKMHPMHGVLLAVGDAAADYCYDRCIELGDTVQYAKYAGVKEVWKHVVGPDDLTCEHDGAWDIVVMPSETLMALSVSGKDKDAIARAKKWDLAGGPNDNIELRECRSCQTLIASEKVIVMSCKDILTSIELQERIERGEVVRHRGVDSDGKTRFYLKRLKDSVGFGDIERELKEVA